MLKDNFNISFRSLVRVGYFEELRLYSFGGNIFVESFGEKV